MDEQRLGQLFRDAVVDLPPASFGSAEVMAASRRATAVRRTAIFGGTVLGVGLLAGTLVVSGLLDGSRLSSRTSTAEQAAPQSDAPAAQPGLMQTFMAPPEDQELAPRSDSADGAQSSCGPADHELAGALTTLLADRGTPASGPASEVSPARAAQLCPAGSRAVAVPVPGGTLYVVVVGRSDLFHPGEQTFPDGTHSDAVTRQGGQLVVILVPAVPGQPPPLAADVPELAEDLAASR